MKIKSISLAVCGILILSAIIFSFCKKDEDNIFEKYPDEFIGSWDIVSGIPEAIITTNSDQETFDFSGQRNGSIQVTGDYEIELNYIFGDGEMLIISNLNIIELLLEETFPIYALLYSPDNGVVEFMVINSEEEIYAYHADNQENLFNHNNGTLSVDNIQLLSMDELTSVTVNGNISFNLLSIPANTPTAIPYLMGIELMNGNFVFSANGNISATIEEEITTGGTWEVLEGEKLQIVFIDTAMTGIDQYDSIAFDYKLALGILTLKMEGESICPVSQSYSREDCLEENEHMFSLDHGSLVEIKEGFQMVLTRTTGTKSLQSVTRTQIFEPRLGTSKNFKFFNRYIIKQLQ